MSAFRIVGEPDRERFDAFVREHGGHPCQAFGGGEPERMRGWEPMHALLEDDGRIVAAMVALKKPLGRLRRWCLMDVVNGPVADFSAEETARVVVGAAVRFARARGAVHLKINPFVENSGVLARVLAQQRFHPARKRWRCRATMCVSLGESAEEMLARMDRITRRRIRHTKLTGLQVSTAQDESDIRDFVGLCEQTYERQRFSGRAPEYLRAMCMPGQHTHLFVVRDEVSACSALLVYAFGRRLIAAHSGSRRPCPPEVGRYIQWCAMLWGKERGFAEYDLGGVPRDPQPQESQWGIYLFKQGFGGNKVDMVEEYERRVSPLLGGALDLMVNARAKLRAVRSSRWLSAHVNTEAGA